MRKCIQFSRDCSLLILRAMIGMAIWACFLANAQGLPAQEEHKDFDVPFVFENLGSVADGTIQIAAPWWDEHVFKSQRSGVQPIDADIESLLFLAVKYSNQIRIAAENPEIRKFAISEAQSQFDWTKYFDTTWNDTSMPVSNSLAAGGGQSRLNDHILQMNGGLRRTNRQGGYLDIGQRFGSQDNNSTFFIPRNQATSQLTISYTHPLLRGRGAAYNESLVVLAQLDAGVAEDDYLAALQNHLLEVARAYWLVYRERAFLAQKVRLYLKTWEVVKLLNARQEIDAQRTQLITAKSALQSRRSDLFRARTSVVNAETQLRGLINAPELGFSDVTELIPKQAPSIEYYDANLKSHLETAIQNRPEAKAAIKLVKAGSTRLGIAEHEMLPALNFVTQGYVNGLRGNSNFFGSWVDQFADGAPSYSVGIQYEIPIGNRLAQARRDQKKAELKQLQFQYDQALATIQTEVDIAVRELKTSYREIEAKNSSLASAQAEVETLDARWRGLIDGNGRASLNLESLLRAQERLTEAEQELTTAILTYNLAEVNLKKVNGTLLQSQSIPVNAELVAGAIVNPFDESSLTESSLMETNMNGESILQKNGSPVLMPDEPTGGARARMQPDLQALPPSTIDAGSPQRPPLEPQTKFERFKDGLRVAKDKLRFRR